MARPHDIFFRHVFQDPKLTTALLRAAARKTPSLMEFIDAVNLDTLQEISGTFAESGETGAADLAFTVNLKSDGYKNAEILVGIIEEHKSSPDANVMNQLLTYWYKLMFRKMENIPTVALIIYNGKYTWNPVSNSMYPEYPAYFHKVGLPFICEFLDVGDSFDLEELKNLDSKAHLAILAMKYAFSGADVGQYLLPAIRAFLEKHPKDQKALVGEIMIYLRETLPKKDKEHIMDLISTKEAYGYETIADAERAEAEARGMAIGLAEGVSQGITQGITQGEHAKALETVRRMLDKGCAWGFITEVTGVTQQEYEKEAK